MHSTQRHLITSLVMSILLTPALCSLSRAEVVSVGAGSYLIQAGGKGDPVRGPNFKGAIPTAQWFTNVCFKGKNCTPQFPHPLMVQPTAGGLKIAYPGNSVSAGAGGINANTPKEGDLVLGCDGGNFNDVALDGYSDWFITVAFMNVGKSMRVSYGHGSPFVYAMFDNCNASISCGNARIWSEGGSVLGISVGQSHYGLFGPTGSTWATGGGKLVNHAGGKFYFSLAVLPDNTPQTLALFKKYAYNHVTDTKVNWKFDNEAGAMKVTYAFTTKSYEGGEGTITALYPHQWKYHDQKLSALTNMVYPSVRGTMKVATGSSFTTSTPIQGVLPFLPPAGVADKSRLAGYLRDLPKGGGPGDTYGEGKNLGKLATFSGIGEAVGDNGTQSQAIGELKRRLEGWFTATAGKGAGVYTYNPNWGILVGLKPSYGSDWPFNDHHFHYGYFIRAAAEVARVDPAWGAKDKWGGMVEMLIREIASPSRDDKLFPLMRCFDRYEGHGWASGNAEFGGGNNQESSSESMNAWYGILMWGMATGDMAMRDFGLYLYTMEMTAIEEYWFDVSATNFPKSYPRPSVGMVWGNGASWGTWFSGDADCVLGIQYLPYTPGSVYLVRYPEYIKRIWPQILQLRQAKTNLNAGWGDLMVMLHAGEDPTDAFKFVESTPNMKIEGGNSRAFFYQWVSTLHTLGTIDRTVTADYPFYNVYNKGGKKTYAVYNPTAKALSVRFSDGKKVECAGRGVAMGQ